VSANGLTDSIFDGSVIYRTIPLTRMTNGITTGAVAEPMALGGRMARSPVVAVETRDGFGGC
jgi:hypothetical protein